ncbi:MAG: YhgE/Pip family protein [Clostridiaceae bacterium]
MKNILKIFKADRKGLRKNFYALALTIGICILPALYAWFNIYANWDPYANTGNIKIAVASLDQGYVDEDGTTINMGDEIKAELKKKTSIGWVFVNTSKEAEDGVYSGDYYAAVVIDEDFTDSMYNAMADNLENPKITYYENQKKNAVATKITDTAISTLQTSINEQFIRAVMANIFETSNGLSEQLEAEDIVNQFTDKLKLVNESLQGYSQIIDSFIAGNEELSSATFSTNTSLDTSKSLIDNGIGQLSQGKTNLNKTQNSFNDFSGEVTGAMTDIQKSIQDISREIDEAKLEEDAKKMSESMEKISTDADQLSTELSKLQSTLEESASEAGGEAVEPTIKQLSIIRQQVEGLVQSAVVVPDMDLESIVANGVDQMQLSLSSYGETVEQINKLYSNQVVPEINDMLNNMSNTLDNVTQLLNNLSGTMDGMKNILSGVDTTLGTLNTSMSQMKVVIENTSEKLTETIDKIEKASSSEQKQIIMNLLTGDPDSYSEFFSKPVEVSTTYVYEIKNYGSGVAPFYTVLAIWVGMTILVSIFSVNAKVEGMINPRPSQLYWGRYLLFFVLSQIQVLIIVLGDLYLLHIQCLYPFQFWLAASVTTVTFSLLIYSLTIAFGDIGKALAVIGLVIQIAGSGGTYPIEALPGFFRAVYIFFPFSYAIDAMRETIGGMYQNTYSVCLMQLGLFCIGALLIGLVVRVPLMKFNHYIEQRMEDTKML